MLLFLSNGVDGWGFPSFLFWTGWTGDVTLPSKLAWWIMLPFLSNGTYRKFTLPFEQEDMWGYPPFKWETFFMYVEILPWRIDFTITLKWGWRVRLPCLSTLPFKQTWQVKLPFLLNGLNGCRYSSYKIGWTWNLTLAFERGRWARLPFLLNKVDK